MSRSGENILRNRNNSLIVQFLSFPGCPLESRARAELEKALAECGLDRYDNVDVMAEQTADDLKAWGSPTILVNGKDVTGHEAFSLIQLRTGRSSIEISNMRRSCA